MSFESSLIAALHASSVSVSDFVKRFAAKDFGLMPVFTSDVVYGGQYPRISRQLYNCLCVCVSWKMVDDLLAKQSQAWLTSGKIPDSESEKLKEIHRRACDLLAEMQHKSLQPDVACTKDVSDQRKRKADKEAEMPPKPKKQCTQSENTVPDTHAE